MRANRPTRRVRTRLSCRLHYPPPLWLDRACRALARPSRAFYASFGTERRGVRRFVVAGGGIFERHATFISCAKWFGPHGNGRGGERRRARMSGRRARTDGGCTPEPPLLHPRLFSVGEAARAAERGMPFVGSSIAQGIGACRDERAERRGEK